jgi:hypothetical protein
MGYLSSHKIADPENRRLSLVNLNARSIFFPNAVNKCVFGLSRLNTDAVSNSGLHLTITATGSVSGPTAFNISFFKIDYVKF